jgi:hypothetical protein
MRLEDLPATSRSYVERIHGFLRACGCEGVTSASAEETDWAKRTFPSWSKRALFPFILARGKTTQLIPPNFYRRHYLMKWHAPGDTMDVENYEAEEIVAAGFLLLGSDACGSFVSVDTRSESGLDVVVIDTASYASFGLREDCICRTKKPLDRFLSWAIESPREFDQILKHHYR